MSTSQWDRSTKQLVSATLVILAGLLLYSFRSLLIPLVLVILFAYIFAPVAGWLSSRLHIGRGWAVMIIYLVGLGALATLPAVTIPVIVNEVENLIKNLDAIADRASDWVTQLGEYRWEFMGYTFALPEIEWPALSFDLDRTMGLLDTTISPLAGGLFEVVKTVASGIGWLVFMSVTGFYLLKDAERFVPTVLNVVPPAYRVESEKLIRRISQTWNAFLRGQIVLCLVIGVLTTVATSAVGIRYSVALGIVAGILEIIPGLGPTLASVPAILLALFQGSSYIPVSKLGVAVIVALIYWMIQSLENNLLVPRIIGSSLSLHPFFVIVGVLGGATLGSTLGPLGGILGALLAAPLLATMRHLLRYTYYKLTDRDPFPAPPSFASKVQERDVRALLFDLDGTLVDSDDALVERWSRRLGQVPLLNRLYHSRQLARWLVMALETPANNLITLLDILGLDKRFFQASEWLRLVSRQGRVKQCAVDGTVRLVRELSERYELAITTTRNREDSQAFIAQFGLDDCFKAIVTRQDVRRLKPHPEPVRNAAKQLGYAPEQCVVIGDTTVDIQAGKRAGALTVGVLCGFGERPELERLEPDLVLETTTQLREFLPDRAGS